MSVLKIGALFAGYGGLDLAVEEVFGAHPVWLSEFDKAPSKILATRYPGVPNHGDVTKIDWASVEPVDIITGGSPCQDLSHAGKRAGMKAGTRSGLWASMCDAIDIIRPGLVVWENVRGALSAEAAAGDVESCEFCVGDPGEPPLRALGRVLGDLAELGYDAAWCGLRAADVGAPHGRYRIFVLAWPGTTTDAGSTPLGVLAASTPGSQARTLEGDQPERADRRGPADLIWGSREWRDLTALLPTPVVNDMGAGKDVDAWDAWTERLKTSHGNGNGHGASLSIEALRMLPTPRATDGTKGGPNQRGSSGDLMLPSAVTHLMPTPRATRGGSGTETMYGLGAERSDDHRPQGQVLLDRIDFGAYGPAIARWESVLGRPAPSPTEPTGKAGAQRLSPRFVEFMMGLPAGWVADIDITRNEQLKALGNGVVPQQAAAALRHLVNIRTQSLETP